MRRAAVIAVGLCAGFAAQGQSLTEAEAVARGLAHSGVRAMFAARRDVAAGEAAAAGRWANPEVEYSEESVDLPGGESEERFLWIRQRLNVAGVPGLERYAAERLAVAEAARVEYAEREIARDIRRTFYAALAAECVRQTAAAWQARLDELTGAVARRVEAGDAARYDHLRLARELSLLKGEVFDLAAEAASARDRLFSRIGAAPSSLEGRLLPPTAGSGPVDALLADHPLLAALDAEVASARLSARAAGREAWPEITLGVGRREVEEPGVAADGNLVMLGVEVPLFDRGDGREAAAAGRARRLAAERGLAANRLAADARAARREVEARRGAALLLAPAGEEPDALSAIAERAYAAGEIGVMELIDAHRADLDAARQAIVRAQAARESYIEWQFLGGNR